MIWALAGLGDGGPYSTYSAEYTPSQKDAPVVLVEEQAGFPWALAGLVAIGLGVAYASYKKDEFEPNKSGRRGGWSRVTIKPGRGRRVSSKLVALRILKKSGAKKANAHARRAWGKSGWMAKGLVKRSRISDLRRMARSAGLLVVARS